MINEKVIYEGKPEWKAYWFAILLTLLTAASTLIYLFIDFGKAFATFLTSVTIIAIAFLHRSSLNYKITDKRIIVKNGIISTRTSEIDINDIRSINVTQGISQKILKLGNLEFSTASGPFKEAIIININDPDLLKENIRVCKEQISR